MTQGRASRALKEQTGWSISALFARGIEEAAPHARHEPSRGACQTATVIAVKDIVRWSRRPGILWLLPGGAIRERRQWRGAQPMKIRVLASAPRTRRHRKASPRSDRADPGRRLGRRPRGTMQHVPAEWQEAVEKENRQRRRQEAGDKRQLPCALALVPAVTPASARATRAARRRPARSWRPCGQAWRSGTPARRRP